MAQNEMKAKPALPERVRSMEGLGVIVDAALKVTIQREGGSVALMRLSSPMPRSHQLLGGAPQPLALTGVPFSGCPTFARTDRESLLLKLAGLLAQELKPSATQFDLVCSRGLCRAGLSSVAFKRPMLMFGFQSASILAGMTPNVQVKRQAPAGRVRARMK